VLTDSGFFDSAIERFFIRIQIEKFMIEVLRSLQIVDTAAGAGIAFMQIDVSWSGSQKFFK